jgi:Asp-tRNA(Asn)/Glu-tRNA(Gln) amidotransferase A subunit family amidase
MPFLTGVRADRTRATPSISRHPAIVFCTGFNADGSPLSMQLVGRHGEDERLLELVNAYQQVTSWHYQHPQSTQ